jgi:steroid delta-isomerase-like uncharacterized protein
MNAKFSNAMTLILQGIWKVLGLIFGTLGMLFLILLPLGLLQMAMARHWAWGFPFVAFLCIAIYLSVQDFKKGRLRTWQGINAITLTMVLTIIVFAFLSFALNRFGLAHYEGFTKQALEETSSITFNFLSFYLWQLFELIPAVKINDALGWNVPLKKLGSVAGFLLIGFRVVVIFVLLKAFRDWWIKRGTIATLDHNKALLKRWFKEVWNDGRADAIDEMFATDGVAYGLGDDPEKDIQGPADFKPFHEVFRGAFPNITVVVEDMVAEGNKVAVRCSVRGTHAGDHLGVAATNAPVKFTGMVIARIEEGKIVEAWNNFDFMRMNKQIGAIL